MKLSFLGMAAFGAGAAWAGVTVQEPTNVVGAGDKAWSYVIVEAESYDSEMDENPEVGFVKVNDSGAIMSALEKPILAKNTTASKKGALWTQSIFAPHTDKVTYKIQFAKPGVYYAYMRFTMFENGGNPASYLNEDSFFFPPDWGKDPQTDWPLSDRGGYTEGCCDAGFLTIPDDDGSPINHGGGGEEGQAFWEGNFYWNSLQTSQFLNSESQGEPKVRHKFTVTQAQVGKPLDFTVSYREGGVTIDLWLFSTNPELMTEYKQAELEKLFLGAAPAPAPPHSLAISLAGKNALLSWPVAATGFSLEANPNLRAGGWTPVATAPVVVGDRNTVSVEAAPFARFFRLKK